MTIQRSRSGLSPMRLQRMHEVLARHVDRGTLPGRVTLISRRGGIYVDTIGAQAIGGGAPMQRDTIFRIASMTKPVTAVAALILVEECTLYVEDETIVQTDVLHNYWKGQIAIGVMINCSKWYSGSEK